MTGTLAQIISLTSYGNDFLSSKQIVNDYYPLNSTFQFCNLVDFRDFKRPLFSKPKETIIAKDPNEWFNYLQLSNCKKIRLYYRHSKNQTFATDHKLAGMVGGGGTWLIETIYDDHSNYWSNRWEVTKKDDPNNKIWSVNYVVTHKKQPVNDLHFDLHETFDLLEKELIEIGDFASEKKLFDWSGIFSKAKTILHHSSPNLEYYHKDLIAEKNYSLLAKQILFAAGSAWVFGGMGSWNDLGFDTKDENQRYEELSARLYDAINQSILAAINSY